MSSNPFKNLGFLGEFIHTLDPQQRVAIPSVWRQCVPEGAFLAIPGSDNDVLLFPPDYLTCLMENARKDPFNAETHMTLKKFGANSRAVVCDKQGRITLDKHLMTKLGDCTKGIRMTGAVTHINLESADNCSGYDPAEDAMTLDLLRKLTNPAEGGSNGE